MIMLRLAFAVLVLLLGVVGMLMGSAVSVSALREGRITTIYSQQGAIKQSSISRATDPDAYWRSFALLGALPLIAGVIFAAGAWRSLQS